MFLYLAERCRQPLATLRERLHLSARGTLLLHFDFESATPKSEIAELIGVDRSTVYREIKRNSGKQGKYNAETAQANAVYRKHRNPGNHTIKKEVWKEVIRLLVEEQWSPEQISNVLRKREMKISYETIYKLIRKDKRNGGCLYKYCRYRLKHRNRPVGGKRTTILNRTSIAERPKEADGTRFGDWELDTIVGKGNKGVIVTLVERQTNYILIRKSNKGKDADEVADIVVKLLMPFKDTLKSITTDNGTEFANHQYITKKLGVTVYFADPHSPWQKLLIENQNALIRQFIPKGTDFDNITHQQNAKIQYKINTRPRKKLDYKTPQECFYGNIV